MALNAAHDAPLPVAHGIDLDAVADDQLVFDYDRDSDTLLVHLHGRGRPAVSIEAGENAYVRLDRSANEIVGLHFENVLRAIVPRHPQLLEHAAAFGMTPFPKGGAPSVPTARRRAALAALATLIVPRAVAGNLR